MRISFIRYPRIYFFVLIILFVMVLLSIHVITIYACEQKEAFFAQQLDSYKTFVAQVAAQQRVDERLQKKSFVVAEQAKKFAVMVISHEGKTKYVAYYHTLVRFLLVLYKHYGVGVASGSITPFDGSRVIGDFSFALLSDIPNHDNCSYDYTLGRYNPWQV